jgi:hypothetical protein
LIQAGLNRTATIGFTTNLTVWSRDIIDLLTQFNGVNLGVSIESFETINDYARWPSTLPVVTDILDKWMEVSRQQKWLVQLRITPTILTIDSLLTVYDYAWANDINVESCNFLQRPEVMRPSVLPLHLRKVIIDSMRDWLNTHRADSVQIINTRHPSFVKEQIAQDLVSYVNYLENEPDESWRLPDLVKYLRRIESTRGNSVLTYLPQYEELFRTAGY